MNCYNGEKYLRETIDSIYAQTYDNWEIIFWDNMSTDNSAGIAKSYDNRLKYFRGERHVSLGEARSLAVDKDESDWLAFLDTDDLWYPNKLERQIKVVENSEYALCYAGIRAIYENGKDPVMNRARRKQIREDEGIRNAVEGKLFGQGKRRYGLNRVMARIADSSMTMVSIIFLVMNLDQLFSTPFLRFFEWIFSELGLVNKASFFPVR